VHFLKLQLIQALLENRHLVLSEAENELMRWSWEDCMVKLVI